MCGLDSDADGILDTEDNCRDMCNSDQLDADEDGIGDVCDDPADDGCLRCGSGAICETVCNPETDTDSDGIPDVVDNCPLNCNSQQLDADDDGDGDVCDDTPGCGGCGGGPPCEQEC
jgi:thrombospondin 2/3/4/5